MRNNESSCSFGLSCQRFTYFQLAIHNISVLGAAVRGLLRSTAYLERNSDDGQLRRVVRGSATFFEKKAYEFTRRLLISEMLRLMEREPRSVIIERLRWNTASARSLHICSTGCALLSRHTADSMCLLLCHQYFLKTTYSTPRRSKPWHRPIISEAWPMILTVQYRLDKFLTL